MSISSISPNTNWFATSKSQNFSKLLTKEAFELLKTLEFKGGVKIIDVQEGFNTKTLENLKELNQKQSQLVMQEIAQVLGLKPDEIKSAVVLVGGLALVKEKLNELKKLKRVSKKQLSILAKDLNLVDEMDVLIFAEDGSDIQTGGLIIIKKSLKEIEASIERNG